MGESILLVGMLHFLVNYKSFHSDLFTIKSIAIATPNWDDLDEWTNKSAQTPISEKKGKCGCGLGLHLVACGVNCSPHISHPKKSRQNERLTYGPVLNKNTCILVKKDQVFSI